MSKVFFYSTVLFVSAVAFRLEAKEVKSEISRVVVYEDRALVTRIGAITVPEGGGELIVPGLPPRLQDDSVRVRGEAGGKVTITGTEVRKGYLVDPLQKKVDELERQLDGLKEERAALDDSLDSLGLQKKFVVSIQSSTADKISEEMLLKSPAPGEWDQVLEFISRSSSKIASGEREVQAERRELDKKITAMEKELNQIRPFLSREAKEVVVAVEAAGDTPLQLELSYVVGGASWRPVYDARADREGKRVDLVYRAEVRQKTGEDWKGVKLALSTARPAVGGRLEELEPWYIDLYKPRPVALGKVLRRAAAPAVGGMLAAGDISREEGVGVGEELVYEAARAEKAGAALTFEVPRSQEVPSDGNFHGVAISRKEVGADFEYVAAPKLVEYPFLLAKFRNQEEYPLLGGKINLFLGPDFVGTSRLDPVAPGEEAELYLGIDEDLKVTRELIGEKTEKGGLLKGKTGYKNFRYRITLENFRPSAEKITLFDQIPVSRSPEIKVELEEAVPEPAVVEEKEKPGILSWKMELEPGEKKTVEFEFAVEYPKDEEIVGL